MSEVRPVERSPAPPANCVIAAAAAPMSGRMFPALTPNWSKLGAARSRPALASATPPVMFLITASPLLVNVSSNFRSAAIEENQKSGWKAWASKAATNFSRGIRYWRLSLTAGIVPAWIK